MSRQATEITKRSGSPELKTIDPKQIETLAYQLWVQRGSPAGSDQEDWFRAEEQLRKASTVQHAA